MTLPEWKTRWKLLAPREKNWVVSAALLVGLAAVWWVLLAPAIATLRTTDARHQALDKQLQQMLALQAQAEQLQSQPRANRDDALRALQASVQKMLGAGAQVSVVGDRVTVTLKSAPADSLAQWLALARSNARATPFEARLVRSVPTPAAPATPAATAVGNKTEEAVPQRNVRWDGTLVMGRPPAR